MTMMRALCLLLALLSVGLAEKRPDNYTYYKTTSLSGAVETITLQQPASGSRLVIPQSATIYCSAACTWTLSIDGSTGATTTAATEIIVSDGSPAPSATVFHTSNVASATTIASYVLTAGEKITIGLSSIRMNGDGITKNVNLATNSITATVTISLSWSEF